MASTPIPGETSQALFCAMVDYMGKPFDRSQLIKIGTKNEYVPKLIRGATYYDRDGKFSLEGFEVTYKTAITRSFMHVKQISKPVTLPNIWKFLTNDPTWFLSSLNIANKLFDSTKTIVSNLHLKFAPKGLDLLYARGDKDIFGGIAEIFKVTNMNVTHYNASGSGRDRLEFKDLNKWNPADIYFATTYASKLISGLASGGTVSPVFTFGSAGTTVESLEFFQSFGLLNAFMKALMDQGHLLPVSLKLAPNQVDTIVKTINFIQGDVLAALKKYRIGYYESDMVGKKTIFDAKDVKIRFTNYSSHVIKFRDAGSFSGDTMSWRGTIESTGGSALDGGITGGSIPYILGRVHHRLAIKFSKAEQKRIQVAAGKISEAMEDQQRSWETLGKWADGGGNSDFSLPGGRSTMKLSTLINSAIRWVIKR